MSAGSQGKAKPAPWPAPTAQGKVPDPDIGWSSFLRRKHSINHKHVVMSQQGDHIGRTLIMKCIRPRTGEKREHCREELFKEKINETGKIETSTFMLEKPLEIDYCSS